MHVAVLGGTGFIGPSIARALVTAGHDVTVISRGRRAVTEPLGGVSYRETDRHDPAALAATLGEAEALVDVMALTADDAEAALRAVPDGARLVVLSSCDVYRAFDSLQNDAVTDPVPMTEDSPLRPERYPRRGTGTGMDDYEKLDVEDAYLARGGSALRLGFVIGPRDAQRREEPILRRLRAGRPSIPLGTSGFTGSRVLVDDIGVGVTQVLAAPTDQVAGEAFNLTEAQSPSAELWARWIIADAGADTDVVRVPDEVVPDDLGLWGHIRQSLLLSSAKATAAFGWAPTGPREATRASVRWHLANPPQDADDEFADDDEALASRRSWR